MVGQYHGPSGTAAMSVIAPVWNVIYSLGLLTGIGGPVLFSVRRGEQNKQNNANLYFTNAVWLTAVFAVLCYIVMWRFEVPVLHLFGANDELLPLAVRYLSSVRFVVPSFMFMQLLSAFLRNDSAPHRPGRKPVVCYNDHGNAGNGLCILADGQARPEIAISHIFAIF